MLAIKNILKERFSGLFLLLLAGIIVFGFSLNSKHVESKNIASEEQKISNEGQILGEANEYSKETTKNSEETNLNVFEENLDSIEKKDTKIINQDISANIPNAYAILKDHLKKYCNKNYDKKKCKNYCSEVKNNKEYKDLYKKYCNNQKDEETIAVSNTTETALTLDFIINSGSGTEKFTVEFKEGETVYELMKKAKAMGKITYEKNTDETYGVYINEINGLKEGSDADWTQNKYWILYVNGKSSSLGCSSHKLNKSDTSIEWKYEKYSF